MNCVTITKGYKGSWLWGYKGGYMNYVMFSMGYIKGTRGYKGTGLLTQTHPLTMNYSHTLFILPFKYTLIPIYP